MERCKKRGIIFVVLSILSFSILGFLKSEVIRHMNTYVISEQVWIPELFLCYHLYSYITSFNLMRVHKKIPKSRRARLTFPEGRRCSGRSSSCPSPCPRDTRCHRGRSRWRLSSPTQVSARKENCHESFNNTFNGDTLEKLDRFTLKIIRCN